METESATAETLLRSKVEAQVRPQLEQIAQDAGLLRAPWEPLLDSHRVVEAVVVLQDEFDSVKIAPDKIVRKGGYDDIDEAIDDIIERLAQIVHKQ